MKGDIAYCVKRGIATFLAIFLGLMLVCSLVPSFAFGEDGFGGAAAVERAADAEGGDDLADSDAGESAGGSASSETDGDASQSGRIYVTQLFLRWCDDYGGPNVFVGQGEQLAQIDITTKGQLVQLNPYYLDNSGSGVMQECANSSTQLGAVSVTWTSSDVSVATVSPQGVVTPISDGAAIITATLTDASLGDPSMGTVSASAPVVIAGQTGEYVSSVQLLHEDGTPIADGETIVLESEDSVPLYYQLGVAITFTNPATGEQRTETRQPTAAGMVPSITWESADGILYVNADTGRVATQEAGIGRIDCKVEGGVGGATVIGSAYFNVQTGQRRAGTPADDLTINVYYEALPDELVESQTFSLDYLASNLDAYTNSYTVNQGSSFMTIRATGYRFIDVMGFMDIKLDEIARFDFGTSDNYGNSAVSYDYLFGSNRYYFPNYDIGSTAEAQVVPPLLATACASVYNESVVLPSVELDDSWRFRLVFGISGAGDENSSKQTYYIHTINVIMQGAPAESLDPNGGGGGNGAGDEGGGIGGGGEGSPSGGYEGGSGSEGDLGIDAVAPSGSYFQGDDSAASDGSDGGGATWRVYQMMRKQDSVLDDPDLENPLAPFVVPAACIAALGGGANSYFGYRRRLYV